MESDYEWGFFVLILVLGIEPRGILPLSYTLQLFLFFILKQGLAKLLRLALNLRSSCLSFPSTGITGVRHAWLHMALLYFISFSLFWGGWGDTGD